MDKSYTIDKKWTLCALASFVGCFILTLSLSNNRNSFRLVSFGNVSVTITSSESLEPSLFVENEKTMNRSTPLVFQSKEPRSNNTGNSSQISSQRAMDKSSTIDKKWTLCALASFVGCFILTLSLSNNRNSFRLVSFGNVSVTITSSESLEPSLFVENEKTMNRSTPLVFQSKEPRSNNTGNSLFVENEKPMNRSTPLVFQSKEPKSNNTGSCNMFDGRWIYKPIENPLYNEYQCPFLSDQVSCQRNGRPDFDYESWSWEANDCEIPRFDGKDLLERLRGKRVVIVGDSLNRNQWESLACLLYSAIPPSRAHVKVQSGVYKVFRAKDYNCSVEFHWSPFLVQLDTNKDHGPNVLRLDKLETSVHKWGGADVMIFNTGHWWVHTGKLRAWNLFQYRGKLIEEMDMESAFETAMKTWAQWIDQNVEPTKTTVFFRSISPEHKGNHWCHNVTQPIMDESYESSFPKPVTDIVERIIGEMRTPVRYLNITKLSGYRRDAHGAMYGGKKRKMIEKEGKQPEAFADCSHWCLPGLPDTWNRLFYALLVSNTSRNSLNSSHEGP